ncbi:MAG: branched-chain-amino-acid transaminase [Thermodesulfobacteriota bacterium]|nr:branched-chain-amino-acid transaminase [Thermodesulfobacteriota bacterium]
MGVYVYLNGDFVPEEQAKISVLDRGFLYGDGLFETMRAYSGHVFMLDDHLSRLYGSIDELGIPLKKNKESMKTAIDRLMEINHLFDAYIRVTVSRGKHSGILTFNDDFNPTVVIMAKALSLYPLESYIEGVRVIVSEVRQNSFSPLSVYKSLSYFNNILAKEEARTKGAFEAILLNSEGQIAEGATSSVFIVKSKRIFTPPVTSHILPGITRKTVLDMSAQLGCEIKEKGITKETFFTSDEVFLTNSIMEIVPVVSIDGHRVGDGTPGIQYKRVIDQYRNLVSAHIEMSNPVQG